MKVPLQSIWPFGSNRVWRTYQGGRVLDRIENRSSCSDGHYPEDWIGSMVSARNPNSKAVDEGLSVVSIEGVGAVSLRDIVSADPHYYLGRAHFERFGIDTRILVKFLDSAIRLHFQVHPTAAFSQQFLGSSSGKAEAYYILETRSEISKPYVYAGFQQPPDPKQLKRWIEEQDIASIESCFHKIPVEKGDVLFIPGGRPHALGEGILMVELMEASDLAVRFEFERGGFVVPPSARYMERDLDFALSVFNFDPIAAEAFRCSPRSKSNSDGVETFELVGEKDTDCFSMHSHRIEKQGSIAGEQCSIVIVAEGEGRVHAGSKSWTLSPYSRFLKAAEAGELRFETKCGMLLLECLPPQGESQ